MIKSDAKNRSKRLRKKLFVDEFKIDGFEIDMRFVDTITEEAMNDFFDEFLADAIEANDMVFGGGGDKEGFSGFVVPAARYESATDKERTLVSEWLDKNDLIAEHKVGELVDANFIL